MQGDPKSIGPYQVERTLGRGGMGVVYVCRHPDMPRSVAVKQTLARGADGQAIARFQREAALLARVKHPGIVAVHALGETDEGPYLVMELVEGEALDGVLSRGALEPAAAARIVRDVARAVGAMHAAGVIHRDIKPSNVILRAEGGAPVLLDFGIARDRDADRLTRTGQVLGTLAYMPPEQASGQSTTELDGRVDVYALGAVLYELLSGVRAHEATGLGPVQLLARIVGPEEPAPLTASPPALAAIVSVAMSKEREARYPTALALASDLDRFLAGERPVALESVRSGRGLVVGGVLAAALAIGLGAVVVVRGRRDAAPAPGPATGRPVGDRPAPPVVPPLWAAQPGEALAYELTFVEVGGGQRIEFGCTLGLRAGEVVDHRLPFTCLVDGFVCKLGVAGLEAGGLSFDSSVRPIDPDHPLGMLEAAVGQPFECALDVRTGEVVVMKGFTAICARVSGGQRAALREFAHMKVPASLSDAERRALEEAAERDVERTITGVFSDAFMHDSLDALSRVRGDARRLPWRSPPGELAFRCDGQAKTVVLRSLTTLFVADEDDVIVRGESRYDARGVEEAHVKQELVRKGTTTCTLEWSMRRSVPR